MNEKIKKAIEVAKGLELGCETCEQQRQRLIELLESCEEPKATENEYEYHTTPGTVIQEGWEYEMTPGYWCTTGQAGDKIGDSSAVNPYFSKTVKIYRSKKVKQPEPEKWVPKAGELAEVFRKGTDEDFVLSGHSGRIVWLHDMDLCVGHAYEVVSISDKGVRLSCGWIFPLNCLRPVAKKPEKWVPHAGEWAKTVIHCPSQPLGSLVRLTQVKDDAAKFVDTTGALRWWALAAFTQPTPSEIAIAERRERLPPIPPGMVWVVDRSEPPHPDAMMLMVHALRWERRLSNEPYLERYEYIKPAEPLADTVSIPATKAEPLEFTIYADMQEG